MGLECGAMAVRTADPRANQKERTRNAIVEGAAAMLREGVMPTVQSAAERALVSRTTAYRYFPTRLHLIEELAGMHPAIRAMTEFAADLPASDAGERLRAVVDRYNGLTLEYEPYMRDTLRMLLVDWDTEQAPGSARTPARYRWVEEALRPLELKDGELRRRLTTALTLMLGIEGVVVMKDACGLSDGETTEMLGWAAGALLRGALAEAGRD